jgi:hypothetical protein
MADLRLLRDQESVCPIEAMIQVLNLCGLARKSDADG